MPAEPAAPLAGPLAEVVAQLQAAGVPLPSARAAPCEAESGGVISLVGAGPGDPELLTLRAMRRLQAADVVLHDNLISEEVLALVPASAELINVGKRCGDVKDRGLQQQEIHDLLLAHAQRDGGRQRVVRLKCGDPFIFGRGGEEVEYLAQHGIRCEIVPGITTAIGAAASCNLPLTHRTFGTNQLRLVVGQCKKFTLPDMDWAEMAQTCGSATVVFYMGFKLIEKICKRLLELGAKGDTPMALVESATSPDQRLLAGTLATMPKICSDVKEEISGPVIFFLGPTAAFPAHIEALGEKASSEERPWKRARASLEGGR